MAALHFKVRGSAGDLYDIEAAAEGRNAYIRCTCAAGLKGQYCKHRFALLDGDVSALVSDNDSDVERLRQLISGTDIEAALRDVADREAILAAAKADLSAAKRRLARAMHD